MITLTMEHINALVRSEFYMQGATAKVPERLMRNQLEDDLLRLAELKLYIIEILAVGGKLFDKKVGP